MRYLLIEVPDEPGDLEAIEVFVAAHWWAVADVTSVVTEPYARGGYPSAARQMLGRMARYRSGTTAIASTPDRP